MGRLARNLIGVSVKECARQLGISDTAILKAIKAGRCERHADGSVGVQAVSQGMSLTADPFRGGQRQAGVFGELPMAPVVETSGVEEAPVAATPEASAVLSPSRSGSAQMPLLAARTLTEQSKAEKSQIDLAILKGTVAEIEPMTRAVFDAMVATRSELLTLPDRLTPIVTPETDAGKIHMAIETEVMRICDTLRDKLQLLILQNAPGAP
jgi:hypothetical protein